MKIFFRLIAILSFTFNFSQNIEQIDIPKGIVYKYADNKIVENAKNLITESLKNPNDYSLIQNELMIGVGLWNRYKKAESLKNIKGKNVTFHVDDQQLDGKFCDTENDAKLIWDKVKEETSDQFIIRKANTEELKYYWAVISFDIEEPLLILETPQHHYILNFLTNGKKLMWIDEFPQRKTINNPIENKTYESKEGIKTYENGKEVFLTGQGQKETKLEKVVFLSGDDELKKNTSVEDISKIIDKTNTIFDELFKNSKKEGKIMIQFELGKDKNNIQFAVKDDLDLEIMKEFEKRVNNEKYPNSRKENIKLMLIYKVNSYDDSEM